MADGIKKTGRGHRRVKLEPRNTPEAGCGSKYGINEYQKVQNSIAGEKLLHFPVKQQLRHSRPHVRAARDCVCVYFGANDTKSFHAGTH